MSSFFPWDYESGQDVLLPEDIAEIMGDLEDDIAKIDEFVEKYVKFAEENDVFTEEFESLIAQLDLTIKELQEIDRKYSQTKVNLNEFQILNLQHKELIRESKNIQNEIKQLDYITI